MPKPNKPRIVIVSDLWGKEKSDWLSYYTSILENHFEIKYYDSCVLGNIDTSDYSEENIHTQFIKGAIERAVENLLKQEKECSLILGFSIGGYIAWKACNNGLRAKKVFAISATRLRYETQKPLGIIELIYGEKDAYKPNAIWFEKLGLKPNLLKDEGHELYVKKGIAKNVCKMILKQ